jgi:hypothetical protein
LSCDANNRQRLCTGTTPSFCPTSQVYDPATGACVDVVRFLVSFAFFIVLHTSFSPLFSLTESTHINTLYSMQCPTGQYKNAANAWLVFSSFSPPCKLHLPLLPSSLRQRRRLPLSLRLLHHLLHSHPLQCLPSSLSTKHLSTLPSTRNLRERHRPHDLLRRSLRHAAVDGREWTVRWCLSGYKDALGLLSKSEQSQRFVRLDLLPLLLSSTNILLPLSPPPTTTQPLPPNLPLRLPLHLFLPRPLSALRWSSGGTRSDGRRRGRYLCDGVSRLWRECGGVGGAFLFVLSSFLSFPFCLRD